MTLTIDVWDPGCALTPCHGVLSEDRMLLVMSCDEGLASDDTCNLVLSVRD